MSGPSMPVGQSEKTELGSDEKVLGVIGEPQPCQADDDFPDGGLQAWLVVLGCFIITAVTVGFR
jgi:hypothetical protein